MQTIESQPKSDRPESPKGTVLQNLALLVVVVVCACFFLEIALRIRFAHSLDFSMEMWKYATQLKEPVDNPQLSFAHAPNRSAFLMGVPVSINTHRLRDREYALDKPPGVYRIVMEGDSTTFGWGVPEDQTSPKQLERALNQEQHPPYQKFEVLNAGVGNYGTVQEYNHYLAYDRAFHPDLVILQYFINDPEPVPKERKLPLIGRSYLLAFMISRYDTMSRLVGNRPAWQDYYSSLYQPDRPGLKAAQQALRDLADATRADGATLVVALLPELHQINNGYPFEREHQIIKDTLAEKKVPVIDLIDGLKGHGPESSLWITPLDDHPNGKANALIVAQEMPWVLAHAGTH